MGKRAKRCKKNSRAKLGVIFLLSVGIAFLGGARVASAATNSWPFTTAANYSYDSQISVTGGLAQYNLPWWNTSWQKRAKITITGTTAGAQTDYQLKVQVPYNANIKSDWGDVRFVASDHSTQLSYFMKERADSTALNYYPCDATNDCIFYVKIPSIPASPSTVDIYMYYGNPTATTTSDPTTTFPFYSTADSTTGWTFQNLWAQMGCRYRTSLYSFGFADLITPPNPCGDYSGNWNAYLTSPTFNLPADANSAYIFYYDDWLETENGGYSETPSYDIMYIYINTGADNLLKKYSGTWDWSSRSLNIDAYEGTGRTMRFRFRTRDNYANNYAGWYLDDMYIVKEASPAPTYSIGTEEDKTTLESQTPTIRPVISGGVSFLEVTQFTHTLGVGNTGQIRYQISNTCCSNWAYWNGSAWVAAAASWAQANDQATVNANITQFDNDIGDGTFYFKAFFKDSAGQKVELDSVDITYTPAPSPTITNVTWPGGSVASCNTVTITGIDFGTTQGTSKVLFNGTDAGTASSWGDTQIIINAPTDLASGNIVVKRDNKYNSNSWSYTVTTPSISSLNPASGYYGAAVTVSGSDFGSCQGSSYVQFYNNKIASTTSWSNSQANVKVPWGAATGNVQVCTAGGGCSAGVPFTVTADNSTWPFTTSTNYTYDSNVIDVTGGEAILEPTNWWNSSWSRRKQIQITGSSAGALTNYPVQISVPYNVNMLANFDDIRFVSADQTTLLNYYREGKAGSVPGTACDVTANCIFWVEVPSIPSASSSPSWTYIYMYYGNAAAPYAGNPCNVLYLYEDWEDADWNACSYTWTYGGSVAPAWQKVTATPAPYQGTYSGRSNPAVGNSQSVWLKTTLSLAAQSRIDFYWMVSSQANNDIFDFAIGGTTQNSISGNVPWQAQSYTLSSGSYEIKWNYGKDWWGTSGSDLGSVDYITVRKYVSPEPTYSLGTIEKVRTTFAGNDDSVIYSNTFVGSIYEATGFDEITPPDHTGQIKYQIGLDCPATGDGSPSNWYYYTAGSWTVAPAASFTYANTATEVDTNIASLNNDVCPGSNFDVYVKAFFRTSGTNYVAVDSIWLYSISDALTVSGTDKATFTDVTKGQTNIVFEQLTLSAASASAITVDTVKIDLLGTAADADIASVKLYDDVNDNGTLELGTDTQLSTTQTFTGGTLTFTGVNKNVVSGVDENLLVVYEIAGGATAGNTVGATLVNNTYVTVTNVGVTIIFNTSPISSSIKTIKNPASLTASFTTPSAPINVNTTQTFNAVLHVQNCSICSAANNVAPTPTDICANYTVVSGTPSSSLVSGPTPASANIADGSTQDFTYSCRADTVGVEYLSGGASGTESNLGTPVTASAVNTPNITINLQASPNWTFNDGGGALGFSNAGTGRTGTGGNSVIFIGNDNGKVYKIKMSDGSKLWSYNTGCGTGIKAPIRWNANVIYFGDECGSLHAVQDTGAATFSSLWNVAVSGSAIRSGIVMAAISGETRLYFGDQGGTLYCKDAADGSTCNSTAWSDATGLGAISSTPARVFDGYIFAASETGNIYRIDENTGTVVTTFTGYTKITAPLVVYPNAYCSAVPSIAGSCIFIGAWDKSFYLLDSADPPGNEQVWRFSPSSPVTAQQFTAGAYVTLVGMSLQNVYVGNDNGSLYKINWQTGAQVWKYPAGSETLSSPIRTTPVVIGSKVYFGADDMKWYRLTDGGTSASIDSGYPATASGVFDGGPAFRGGVLAIGNADNNLRGYPQ